MGRRVSEVVLNTQIKRYTPMYYLRSTPFTDHGEFNYDGMLDEAFFFRYLYSAEGQSLDLANSIKRSLDGYQHKTILLTGGQGCGKTTFVHWLPQHCSGQGFIFFDFDKDTSHPTLEEYIEIFSKYFHGLITDHGHDTVNKCFYNLYRRNRNLIHEKCNADNKIGEFFVAFDNLFVSYRGDSSNRDDFIKLISGLFFNQILSLIVLWHIAKLITEGRRAERLVLCLDNLDVLVNQDIIERFFKEYNRFVRNIDGIVNGLDDDYLNDERVTYNSMFAFLLVCKQHTWARVKRQYPHDHAAAHVSTLYKSLNDAYDKASILSRRQEYVSVNGAFFGSFADKVLSVHALLNDLDETLNGHTIYDLFNGDYRQCILTIEDVLQENPQLVDAYITVRKRVSKANQGLRGIIYRQLFEKFRDEGILEEIGVLDMEKDYPLASNARLLLSYLDYSTSSRRGISFNRIVSDFEGIISREDVDNSLVAMFTLGYKPAWNELVAFNEIDTEEVVSCEGAEVFITTAGHEYLDFVATHFEFFSTRVTRRRFSGGPALFLDESIEPYARSGVEYEVAGSKHLIKYNFEETIYSVMRMVERCCEKNSVFYADHMQDRYPNLTEYLSSPFVYGEPGVLHGERVVHTHIRYIDNYRVYLLKRFGLSESVKRDVNKRLVRFIAEYMRIGERYQYVLTAKSTDQLFPKFKERIVKIEESGYTDEKPIDVYVR